MEQEMQTQSNRVKPFKAWYVSAVATASVGAAFSLIFLVWLIVNHIEIRTIGLQQEEALVAIKASLNDNPKQTELIPQIRALDLQFRRERLQRLALSSKSAYLLLASALVFLLGIKWAGQCQSKQPCPQPLGDESERQIREAVLSRRALAGGFFLLLACAAGFALSDRAPFDKARDAEPAWASAEEIAQNWHRFRGPEGAGVCTFADIPEKWDGASGEGILWKTPVPLLGFNSPVAWGDRVFCSGAHEEKRQVFCFDANSGKLLWTGDVPTVKRPEGEELDIMEDTGLAAGTMATDGRRVYAIFATGDLAAFNFEGKRLWHKNLGLPDNVYGHATSLETYRNRVLVQFDQGDSDDDKSKLLAFDGKSGKLVWEQTRPVANSWTSPIVVKVGAQDQLITVADPWTIGYDAATGAEIWRAELVGGDVAASPVYGGDMLFVIEPYAQMVGLRPDGKGNITETHIAWQNEDGGPDIASPVCDGEHVYHLDVTGLLMCIKVSDGSLVYEHELDEEFNASPSLVGDKLYMLDMNGTMHIGAAGKAFKALGQCSIGEKEKFVASPAFLDGRIFIRGSQNLWCIGRKNRQETGAQQSDQAQDARPAWASAEEIAQNWHRFRGPGGAGVCCLADIPEKWDGTSGEGILWKAAVPLLGFNSPVVWGDRVFCSGADEEKRQVFCFDAHSGKLRWTGAVPTVKLSGDEELEVMEDTGLAAGTMATDGRRVYAIFATGDLAAFNLEGKQLWHKNLGLPDSVYGYASSLATYRNRVLVQFDQGDSDDKTSKLLAFDGASGQLMWEQIRPVANSWTSPIVVKVGTQDQLITVADPWTMGYDPATGAEIWRAELVGGDVAASPVYGGGLLFVIEPYAQMLALRPDGKGNITETHIAWQNEDGGPDISSPVCDGEFVYHLDTMGLLMCIKVSDGSLVYEHELDEEFNASPSLVGDKLYMLDMNGAMHIGLAGKEFKALGKCPLGEKEKFVASPAFLDGRIYIRGTQYLWCVGSKDK